MIIDRQKCNGCGICRNTCSFGAIFLVAKKAYLDQSRCKLCGKCISACPVQAIQSIVTMPHAEQIQPAKSLQLPTFKAAAARVGSISAPDSMPRSSHVIISALKSKPGRMVLINRRTHKSGGKNRRRFRGGI